MQQILFPPEKTWQLPNLAELPSWKNAKRVGIDTETYDPQLKELGPGVRRGGKIVGISFTIEDGPSYYLPFGHATGNNLNKSNVIQYVQQQAKDFTGIIVGANLAYDLDYLAQENIVFRGASDFRDVQIADPLIYELHFKYSLDAIAERWECPLKMEDRLREAAELYRVDPKAGLWKLDPAYCGEYAETDSRNPLLILRRQERKIEEIDSENQDGTKGLLDIFRLESKVLPVLVKMRRRGIRIDLDKLQYIKRWCGEELAKEFDTIHNHTGYRINSGDLQIGEALAPIITYVGLKYQLTPKTKKPNIDQRLLSSSDHPVLKSLQRCRKLQKLRNDFVGSIERHITNGRIHCTFNQLKKSKESDQDGDETSGAAYGRLSAEHVNMQQQPSRDEFAKMWRSIYLPDEGKEWCSCDFSQQEPRMLTHYAVLCNCKRAKEAAQRYIDDPNTDNHKLMTDITGLGEKYGYEKGRKYAKVIFLGLCYSMGGSKLCRQLGLPTATKKLDDGRIIEVAGPEGQSIIKQFDDNVPYVKQLSRLCENAAKNKGTIRTISGRVCHFPKDALGNYDWTNKALNRLIQGSAADQTKTAMVLADEAGLKLQLQVHDELCMSVSKREEAEQLAQIMRDSIPLKLPMKVDIEIGNSWGDSMG